MMPLSYQGFGTTAIGLMLLVLAGEQLFHYLRHRGHQEKMP
jgi:hypothetical protein